jgi:hypothetical protein
MHKLQVFLAGGCQFLVQFSKIMDCRFLFALSRSVQVESRYAQFSGDLKVKKAVVAHVNHLSWRDSADVAYFLENVD